MSDNPNVVVLGVVDIDYLMVGGPLDGTTLRLKEGNEPNADGVSYRVVRTDRIVNEAAGWPGEYVRKRLSPKVIVYEWQRRPPWPHVAHDDWWCECGAKRPCPALDGAL